MKVSVVETVQSVEKKKERETPRVCGISPAIWTLSSLPLSPPTLLLPPFPLLSSADWCAIHGGPISPFSVLRLLATIHANEVEQMTFLRGVHACVRACVCVCERACACVCEWADGLLNSSNLSGSLPNHSLNCCKMC